jgi:phospholipid/cholesterol/gamma-HCH transport system ATP-binding protein
MSIMSVRGLDIGYEAHTVAAGLEFSVPTSKVTVVIGTSGCGKTTLLKTLAGLIPPLSGEVVFAGAPVDYRSEASLRDLYMRIGVLYQDSALLNSLTLYENIALPVRMHVPDIPEALVKEMVFDRLAQVQLADSAGKYPVELSGGMRKRGGLARALVLDPAVVLCDEPSGGLDPITFGTTLVIVTHELRSIARLADLVVVLHEGRLHFRGSLEEVLASDDPFIRSFFLRKVDHDDA